MKDINGVELAVGDDVIYTNRNLYELNKGKVFKITKDRLIVKYREDYSGSYEYPIGSGIIIKYTTKHHHNIMNSSQIMKLG
jgi:hypothetical protein